MDPTVKKVLTGAGLLGAGLLAEGLEPRSTADLEKKSLKETGRIFSEEDKTKPTPEAGTIFAAHLKKTKSGFPAGLQGEEDSGGGAYDFRNDALLLGQHAGNYTLAHELGHREIEKTPGIMQKVQRHLYGVSPEVGALIRTPALAAIGYFAPNTRRALAYGLATQYITDAGMLASEHVANKNAMGYMEAAGQPVDKSLPRQQITNYIASPVSRALLPIGIGVTAKGLMQNPNVRDYVKAAWQKSAFGQL